MHCRRKDTRSSGVNFPDSALVRLTGHLPGIVLLKRPVYGSQMVSLLAPGLYLLCAIAASATSLGASPMPRTRTVYFTATDARGELVRGLKAHDLALSENGLPRPILALGESPDHREENSTVLRRLFVVYFDDDLTLRQLFRARRWLLRALPELAPNDAIAVYRSSRLSSFKNRRSSMRDLVRYSGVELFLGLPVGSAYSPSPLALHPDLLVCAHPGCSRHALDELRVLYDHGAQGDLMTVLGALKDIPGRKILLYFGGRLAALDSPRNLDWKTASLLLDDAAITLYAIAPTDIDQLGSPLGKVARATGGDVLGSIEALKTTLPGLLEETSHYYAASYQSSLPVDGQFRRISITGTHRALRIEHPEGYFSTVAGAHGVSGRTFLTVLQRPEGYSDFPFLLAVEPFRDSERLAERRHLKLRVTVPLERLRLKFTKPGGESSASHLSHELQMLAVALDRQGRVAGTWIRHYRLQINNPDAGPGTPRQGFLEESLDIDPDKAHSLRVILISGLNDQISTQVQEL